jgi:hypothetical protein
MGDGSRTESVIQRFAVCVLPIGAGPDVIVVIDNVLLTFAAVSVGDHIRVWSTARLGGYFHFEMLGERGMDGVKWGEFEFEALEINGEPGIVDARCGLDVC